MKKKFFYIYGIHPIIEGIKSGKKIYKIFINKNYSKKKNKNKLILLAKKKKIPLFFVSLKKINYFTKKNHQGFIAFISNINFYKIENIIPLIYEKGKIPLLLILDSITDIKNFGAIIRTSVCNNVDSIIIPKKNIASINSEIVKSSCGAIFHIPICKENNLLKTILFLKNYGIKIFSITEKGNTLLYKENFKCPMAIILGNEEKGILNDYLLLSDNKIRIPINNKILSLNVSVTCGIVLYEIYKQRLK
ncbi:23S rRNA (guanosine(2251)-2'-O)-methyltransferase RlmB [Candidatus Shikimatogenerans silvanidophilus]|uniref:23S rRNA (guanosine(2251)-2'-O)-methyltransferase RlmB n=1 Tax=Candidatus Shikimatogenerans silvanidophilus TaxID=2782547 RepID=UPI001BA79893|nr:23S rRNA (guanosine(2251)-2'-O)-methyltransferase RlmB [Candidatus Shikimatogenerans silvanidophilus]